MLTRYNRSVRNTHISCQAAGIEAGPSSSLLLMLLVRRWRTKDGMAISVHEEQSEPELLPASGGNSAA
jgi:hypothetical protein